MTDLEAQMAHDRLLSAAIGGGIGIVIMLGAMAYCLWVYGP
jgi:hypothetical protein